MISKHKENQLYFPKNLKQKQQWFQPAAEVNLRWWHSDNLTGCSCNSEHDCVFLRCTERNKRNLTVAVTADRWVGAFYQWKGEAADLLLRYSSISLPQPGSGQTHLHTVTHLPPWTCRPEPAVLNLPPWTCRRKPAILNPLPWTSLTSVCGDCTCVHVGLRQTSCRCQPALQQMASKRWW